MSRVVAFLLVGRLLAAMAGGTIHAPAAQGWSLAQGAPDGLGSSPEPEGTLTPRAAPRPTGLAEPHSTVAPALAPRTRPHAAQARAPPHPSA